MRLSRHRNGRHLMMLLRLPLTESNRRTRCHLVHLDCILRDEPCEHLRELKYAARVTMSVCEESSQSLRLTLVGG